MKRLSFARLSSVHSLRQIAWLREWRGPLIAVIILFLAFFGNSFRAGEKTYIVDATVAGATINFHGNQNAWFVGNAVVCTPKAQRSRQRSTSDESQLCDTRLYDVTSAEDLILDWPDAAQVRLRTSISGRLEMVVLEKNSTYMKNTLFILPEDFFFNNGALSFAGAVTFGRPINTGAKDILLNGSYRVREDHILSFLLGKQTYQIAQADLTRGDQVRVVEAKNPSVSSTGFSHMTYSTDVDRAIHLVFHSVPGEHALEVATYGMAEPTIIRPNWIDSTLASPFILIVGLFLSLAISMLELFAMLKRQD